MKKIVELFWLTIPVIYTAWITYQSYSVIPEPPCDWWAFLKPLEKPPGLGMPQIALMATLVAVFATLSFSFRSSSKRTVFFFALMVPLLTVLIPLTGVVDMEIYGGCIQMGGLELSRYNSFESLIVLLLFGSIPYAAFATLISMIIYISIYIARRTAE